ncbi:GMC family oxidoreductase [Pseudomonas asiatica]|uniref:FAD-dependent oxidoreductase n=1 Tax=Pseudomonas asiatica TaxID=2219225 RepID=UPI0018AC22E3|nr:GMC family oxidoreductase [Pseudomonas asiatica]MBF8805626.1 GMC family oxidoreductase [Pseudomonas asiatica]MBH3379986.1 GMC family oxidoreductase [Pseudomonas asiatica]WDM86802.1 GMC family oxidoreductase [Pseudomonas asiatica]
MIRDYQQQKALRDSYDVCIIGAGPAGITLGLRLAAAGWSVLLAEGGGREYSANSQALYACASTGLELYAGEARLRYLGGTSNHWAGRCRPFSPSDFAVPPIGGLPGWPIPYSEIAGYLPAAMDIVDLPPGANFRALNDGLDGGDFEPDRFLLSPPTRFAQKYATALEQTQGLDVFINCNCVNLEFDQASGHLAAVVLSDYECNRQRLVARNFVLATGAIENARQLLNSESLAAAGIVSKDGLVGGCFMEHLNIDLGTFILNSGPAPDPREYYTTDAFVEEYKAGKGNVRAALLADVQTYGRTAEVKHFLENLVCDMGVASKIAFVAKFNCPGDGVISTMIEQFPNLHSRISLLEEKDALGVAKVNVNWALTADDRHTIKCIGSELAKQWVAMDLGYIKLNDFVYDTSIPLKLSPHAHHMGTTRMASSAQFGVVDTNCKVFGTENLYVAGSSIFATGGACNPTMPLLQFAVRLADHLDARLSAASDAVG